MKVMIEIGRRIIIPVLCKTLVELPKLLKGYLNKWKGSALFNFSTKREISAREEKNRNEIPLTWEQKLKIFP